MGLRRHHYGLMVGRLVLAALTLIVVVISFAASRSEVRIAHSYDSAGALPRAATFVVDQPAVGVTLAVSGETVNLGYDYDPAINTASVRSAADRSQAAESRCLRSGGLAEYLRPGSSPIAPVVAAENVPSGEARFIANSQGDIADLQSGARFQAAESTQPGERFVRVGVMPERLGFTFDTPGGIAPRTYAFPEDVFAQFGNDPAAIKNFGDLPGAPPSVYRTLEPPPGTPIQRGVVPGFQFGGEGGVPEVFSPKGF